MTAPSEVLVNPCRELPAQLTEEQIQAACDAVTASGFAVELVTNFGLAMTLALVEAGFPQLGVPSGLTVMNGAEQDALICGQQLKEPETNAVLTLATALVIDKRPASFGAMLVRWDILRELQKDRKEANPGRKLVTQAAFEVPALAPELVSPTLDLLLSHLRTQRSFIIAKVVRDRSQTAAARLVEALAP